MNFISNAVKFSISGSVVNIEVGSAVKKVPRRPSDAASVYSSVRSSAANSRKMSRFSRRNRINTTPSVPTAISKDQEIRFVTVIVNDLGVGIPEDDHGKTGTQTNNKN